VLLRSAASALYRPHWTDIILNEVKRAIVEHRMADQARAQRLVDRLRDAFPEAEIHGYEPLLQLMWYRRLSEQVKRELLPFARPAAAAK
jgi:hypothetical protein